MRWLTWWHILIVLQARGLAQSNTPTVCEEEACRCDAFTRVICNCTREYTEITLRPDGAYRVPPTTTAIIIDGCNRVTFLQDTVLHLIQLRNVELKNVNRVVINRHALAWSLFPNDMDMKPGIRITIDNCTVNEISSYAIQGRIDDILISNSRVENIRPFAFSSLAGVKNIELTNNVFHNIGIQSFKKFTTVNFILRGGVIDSLPSRFLTDIEVTNLLRIEGVSIKYFYSSTFLVNSPKRVIVESNNIETLEGDAFHVATRGPITFRNNTVTNLGKGSFFGFTVDSEVWSVMGSQELLIENNTITHLTPASLMYNRTRLNMRVDELNINVTCACELVEEWRLMLKEHGGTINCWYPLEARYISLPSHVEKRCGTFKETFWIFVVIGVVLVLIVAAIAVFFIVRHENEKKKKVQIVMPDGKTYRETEFHIVVERAELLITDL